MRNMRAPLTMNKRLGLCLLVAMLNGALFALIGIPVLPWWQAIVLDLSAGAMGVLIAWAVGLVHWTGQCPDALPSPPSPPSPLSPLSPMPTHIHVGNVDGTWGWQTAEDTGDDEHDDNDDEDDEEEEWHYDQAQSCEWPSFN